MGGRCGRDLFNSRVLSRSASVNSCTACSSSAMRADTPGDSMMNINNDMNGLGGALSIECLKLCELPFQPRTKPPASQRSAFPPLTVRHSLECLFFLVTERSPCDAEQFCPLNGAHPRVLPLLGCTKFKEWGKGLLSTLSSHREAIGLPGKTLRLVFQYIAFGAACGAVFFLGLLRSERLETSPLLAKRLKGGLRIPRALL